MITGQWHGALAGIRGAEQNGDDAIVAGGARYLAGVAINDHARTLNAGSDTALLIGCGRRGSDAAISGGLLARPTELGPGHNLDVIARRAPTARHRLDVLRQHLVLFHGHLTRQGRVPVLAGSDRPGDVEARQIAAMPTAKTRGLIR